MLGLIVFAWFFIVEVLIQFFDYVLIFYILF